MQGLNTTHPASEQLASFGLGRLPEEDSLAIEQHLADCEECRSKLEELPGDDLVSLLQAPPLDTQFGLGAASADTDSSSLSKEAESPLYKKLAQILAGQDGKSPSPAPVGAAAPALRPILRPGFSVPKELAEHARYLLLDALGSGGMGTVYKAQHRLMERLVALKIVNPLLINRPGATERFQREVRAAAKLVHPNVVTAFDAEKVGELHILVMEFVEGQTLAEVLAAERELPVAKGCDYVRQTALGLQHALERGMVHRDIKPQNLMRTSNGEIKILDFGLARFVSEEGPLGTSTEHGSLLGSPDYMAPEQGQDAHSADTRADIYSMGCTLYHLLAGQVPFPESALLSKLEAHRDKAPIPLHFVRTGVSVALSKVVDKMLAKDPGERFQTPAQVAEALRPFTQPWTATPSTPADRVERPRSRVPILVAGLVLLILLMVGGYKLAQVIFRVETPRGTLIVQTDDPDVQVSVQSAGKQVVLFFPKEKKEIPLKLGEYTLEIVGGKEGLTLSTNKVAITSAKDPHVVTVEFIPRPVVAQKEVPKVEPPAPSKPADPVLPTVEELLKTREVLYVAQDGSEIFKTIGAALDAVQANQVILVKDKGPYREFIFKDVPANVALISQVGTHIELPKYQMWAESSEKGKHWYYGAWLNVQTGFRMSGFAWVGKAERPANLIGGMLFALVPFGDACIENCSFIAPDYLTGLTCRYSGSQQPARRIFQENYANRALEFHETPGTLILQHNYVLASVYGAVSIQQRNTDVLIRENVLIAPWGIVINCVQHDTSVPAFGADYKIHNNILDTSSAPIAVWKRGPDKAKELLPRSFHIVNNIFRSRTGSGISLLPEQREALRGQSTVGPNIYSAAPKAQADSKHVPWPIGPRDQIVAKHFLSVDPKDPNYLRIDASGPLATGGVGGELPSHFGAFPPGPAPKDGDWFTRLKSLH